MSSRSRLARQVCANRARFTPRRPRSTRGRLPRGWPARWSGPRTVVPAMAARNGPTSPSSRHVRRSPSTTRSLTPATPSSAGGRAVEAQLHDAASPGQQLRHVLDRGQPAVADDRHPIAHPLDLGQDVRREEDRPTGGAALVEDVVERPLHERVEALRRLVEDGQLRVVLERLDDADLLAHPARVGPDRATQRLVGELELGDEGIAQDRRSSGQGRQLVEQPIPGQVVPEGDAAGQVAGAARMATLSRSMSCPRTVALPAVGWRKPSSSRMSVDLPAPFGPEEAEDLALVAPRCRGRPARPAPSRHAASPGRSRAACRSPWSARASRWPSRPTA